MVFAFLALPTTFSFSLNWPAAALFLGVVFLLVFRTQIAGILMRIQRFKLSGCEIDTTSGKKKKGGPRAGRRALN